MRVVFLAGGIASGKSTVAREFERLGARRIDLDRVSRDVLAAGTETIRVVAAAFGADLVDPRTGELDRRTLAARAFSSPERAALLESIELPAIRALLAERIEEERRRPDGCGCVVVEVPLLDRVGEAIELADEVVAVCCPADERLRRAVARGMDRADAAARMANQPSDEWLRAHADTVFDNVGTADDLRALVRRWWDDRQTCGEGASRHVRRARAAYDAPSG